MQRTDSHSPACADPLSLAREILGSNPARVEAIIESTYGSSISLISDVSRHLVGAGGKRVRPLLLLLWVEASGQPSERGVGLAAAAELLHNATLLHDDVADRAYVRRGAASAPRIYGNSASVLVGDYLMAQALAAVVDHGDIDLVRELCGVLKAMAEGEVLQLVRSGRFALQHEDYVQVIAGKTAGLFSWSCRAGAACGASDEQLQERAAKFGRAFGMAFQIRDDVLDYTASLEQSGKDVWNDLEQGKATLPLLLACEEDRELFGLVETLCQDLSSGPTAVTRIVERVRATSALARASEAARQYVAEAVTQLEGLERSAAAKALVALAKHVGSASC